MVREESVAAGAVRLAATMQTHVQICSLGLSHQSNRRAASTTSTAVRAMATHEFEFAQNVVDEE